MKKLVKKSPVLAVLFVLAVLLLAVSGIQTGRAALTYKSENYETQVDMKNIGIDILENGDVVSGGVLLEKMLSGDSGETDLVFGQTYTEELADKNTGSIDQFARVTVTKYWADIKGTDESGNPVAGEKRPDLNPEYIELGLSDAGWVEDGSVRTDEQCVLYCTSKLASSQVSKPFAVSVSINPNAGRYTNCMFVIEVSADAVQTHNAESAVKSAWGVSVTVNDAGLSLKEGGN